METILNLWCDHQVNAKKILLIRTRCANCLVISERLKEETGEVAKDEMFEASNGWFSLLKSCAVIGITFQEMERRQALMRGCVSLSRETSVYYRRRLPY